MIAYFLIRALFGDISNFSTILCCVTILEVHGLKTLLPSLVKVTALQTLSSESYKCFKSWPQVSLQNLEEIVGFQS